MKGSVLVDLVGACELGMLADEIWAMEKVSRAVCIVSFYIEYGEQELLSRTFHHCCSRSSAAFSWRIRGVVTACQKETKGIRQNMEGIAGKRDAVPNIEAQERRPGTYGVADKD